MLTDIREKSRNYVLNVHKKRKSKNKMERHIAASNKSTTLHIYAPSIKNNGAFVLRNRILSLVYPTIGIYMHRKWLNIYINHYSESIN